MSKKNIWIISIVIVIAALGFVAMRQMAAKKAAAETPATETAIVERGDLSVTVEAAGSLTPPAEITLAFPVAGKLYEIPVSEGQAISGAYLWLLPYWTKWKRKNVQVRS